MQPLEAHRAMPEERPPGTGPEPSLGELPGDDQRLAAEGKDLAEHAGAQTRSRARKEEMEKSAAALNIKDGNAPAPSIQSDPKPAPVSVDEKEVAPPAQSSKDAGTTHRPAAGAVSGEDSKPLDPADGAEQLEPAGANGESPARGARADQLKEFLTRHAVVGKKQLRNFLLNLTLEQKQELTLLISEQVHECRTPGEDDDPRTAIEMFCTKTAAADRYRLHHFLTHEFEVVRETSGSENPGETVLTSGEMTPLSSAASQILKMARVIDAAEAADVNISATMPARGRQPCRGRAHEPGGLGELLYRRGRRSLRYSPGSRRDDAA